MLNNTRSVKVGETIPSLIKTALMPIDPEARNVIHTDDYAKKVGLRGALIGGSTLLSYMLEMLYNYFGQNWLYHGKIKVNFIGGGAINGDIVTAQGLITDIDQKKDGIRLKLNIWLENQDQKKILVGEAECSII